MKPTIHIASCSFGKDSLATILIALEKGEPLDRVVFSEVMYDKRRGISGENPEHITWIRSHAIPYLEAQGLKVDVVRSDIDYIDHFVTRIEKEGPNYGKFRGFPMGGKCHINNYCKVGPIKKYTKELSETYDVIQYIGIAADETKRLEKLDGVSRISLLAKYGVTEAKAMEMCRRVGLLSPIYEYSHRGGCWFCPNQNTAAFARVRKEMPQLWNELYRFSQLPNLVKRSFRWETSFIELDLKIDYYEARQRDACATQK